MPICPEVLWAQRSNATDETKNLLFITVRVPDSTNTKIDLTSTSLKIESDSEDSDSHYHLAIDFFQEVVPEESKHSKSGNAIKFVIRKKEKQEEYWPRLTKEKVKYHYIKTDFDKWVDEDEQDEVEDKDELDMAGLPPMGDMAGMGGMGGMPGMGDAGGMGGMPGMPGGLDLEQMAKENPQLNSLRGPDGQFDLNKLMGSMPTPSVNTSNATEADFSSSDDDEEEDENEIQLKETDNLIDD